MGNDPYGNSNGGYGIAEDAENVLGPVNLDPLKGLSDQVQDLRDESGAIAFPGKYAANGYGKPSISADKSGSSAYAPDQQQDNPYMQYWGTQLLSGFGKGVVRGLGLQVHPSLDKDTSLEKFTSRFTEIMHPGLNIPKAAISTIQMADGQKPVTVGNVAETGKDILFGINPILPYPAKDLIDLASDTDKMHQAVAPVIP